MYKLSSFFDGVERDATFLQTQFANTSISQSFCYVAKEQYLNQANKNPNISCIVVPEKLASKVSLDKGVAIADDAEKQFYQLHNMLFLKYKMRPEMVFGRCSSAFVHPSAVVPEKTYIGERAWIGAGVIIEDNCYIGDDVCIEGGAIIGSVGHYYKHYDGKLFRVEHAGGVWLERGVQVLAGAIVSKALHTDFTRVGEDSVVSIQAHVGHGCNIGKRCTLTGNVQVSGFTTLGDDVWVGPSATIGNLLSIGDKARIETGSVVVKSVGAGERVSGNFAWNHRANIRDYSMKVRGS